MKVLSVTKKQHLKWKEYNADFGEKGLEQLLLKTNTGDQFAVSLSLAEKKAGKWWEQSCIRRMTIIKGNSCTLLTHIATQFQLRRYKKGKAGLTKCLRYVASKKRLELITHEIGKCPYSLYEKDYILFGKEF